MQKVEEKQFDVKGRCGGFFRVPYPCCEWQAIPAAFNF
jgi:hypothetical protein